MVSVGDVNGSTIVGGVLLSDVTACPTGLTDVSASVLAAYPIHESRGMAQRG
ncbi:hypothetical protein GCM10011491_43780 [Brucella endophytica]|uniref:Uncharacterized protein n=1 Tax=Brucella endophytica TaxID=1963359 RepID=A0A916WM30_9HYPH|nr:hypothetical protein GCM10011491_43780 [Brucella endophytica]